MVFFLGLFYIVGVLYGVYAGHITNWEAIQSFLNLAEGLLLMVLGIIIGYWTE